MPDYTRWLNNSSTSDESQVFAGLYNELKQIAARRIAGERPGRLLDATALVHEAWMRVQKSAPDQWRDRKQFYAAAAEAMRRILVEAARRRLANKRGNGNANLDIDHINPAEPEKDLRLLDIHEALDQLEAEDETAARIVKLKFFGGMNYAEIAALMEISEKSVQRHWATAKIWLYRALKK